VTGCCGHGNKIPGYIEAGEFVDWESARLPRRFQWLCPESGSLSPSFDGGGPYVRYQASLCEVCGG